MKAITVSLLFFVVAIWGYVLYQAAQFFLWILHV
jgi:hypothetical protein